MTTTQRTRRSSAEAEPEQRPRATAADRIAAYDGKGEPGTFRPDGSWDFKPQERTPAYRFVQRLIELRENSASPQDVAAYVRESPFPDILGPPLVLEQWGAIHHGQYWPSAMASTSAAATVKRFRSLIPFPEIPDDCACGSCVAWREEESNQGG